MQNTIAAREIKVGDTISFDAAGFVGGIVASREPQYTQHTHFVLADGRKFSLYSGTKVTRK